VVISLILDGRKPPLENRITELEIKLAHQEMVIEQLNQVVTEQQKEIASIKLYMEALKSKFDSIQFPEKSLPEAPPPHY